MTVSFDTRFVDVVRACAAPRPGQAPLTWITPSTAELYCRLHAMGHAHSVEVWDEEKNLVGGLFGLAFGNIFSLLSMFHLASNASKIGIVSLCHHLETWKFEAIDQQTMTQWVRDMGGREIPRDAYRALLQRPLTASVRPGRWQVEHLPADTAAWRPAPRDIGLSG